MYLLTSSERSTTLLERRGSVLFSSTRHLIVLKNKLFPLLICLTLCSTTGLAQSSAPHPSVSAAPGEVEALLDATDDANRGGSSHSQITMRVKTDRYERTMKLEAWTEGTERSLIRVLAPKREAGISTLKVGDDAWNYLPKIDRTLKISSSAMGGAWMGSHISNDDLVRGSRLREAYTWVLKSRPNEAGEGHYELHLKAKPDAPVVWGSIQLKMSAKKTPMSIKYFNERGVLIRTMTFEALKEINGRWVPMEMRVTPAKAKGEYTELIYDSLEFDMKIPPRTFSLQALKR